MRTVTTISAVLFLACLTSYGLPESTGAARTDGRTNVSDSTLRVETEGSFDALNESRINAGIKAKNSSIRDSDISSKTKADVKASNFSNVNTGIKINDGADVRDSKLSSRTQAKTIDANNSQVSTGIEVSEARNSDIRTNVSAGSITARDATVNVGTVKGNVQNKKINTDVGVGDISAVHEKINIGNVTVNDQPGGKSRVFNKPDNLLNADRSTKNTNIGNVTVESRRVSEVNVTVGEGGDGKSVGEKIKAKHMAEYYSSKEDGLDPSGTKHIYVSDRERDKAEREKGDAGNTTVEKGSKVKKVDVYVDK
ncbi:MAG: hypothetical protein WC637_18875 [Victivallales bacterium]|jgi:hypothetical protein